MGLVLGAKVTDANEGDIWCRKKGIGKGEQEMREKRCHVGELVLSFRKYGAYDLPYPIFCDYYCKGKCQNTGLCVS